MKKFMSVLALCLMMVIVVGPIAGNAAAYSSFTYSIDGEQLLSPDGYTPSRTVTSEYMGLHAALNEPTDLVTDEDGNVYIADPNNNRIIILDQYYKLIYELKTFVNDQGINDALSGARGLSVTDKYIFVADTGLKRVLVFEKYNAEIGKCAFVNRFEEPESDSFAKDSTYMPVAVAADRAGRMYVVSATTYEGIIALNADGTFSGFVGAQKGNYDALALFWRKFQTKEQREASESNLSVEYNNITIDEKGFTYATTSAIDPAKQQAAIESGSSDGTYAPVKKLNTAGDDIMRRAGFFPPSGAVSVTSENAAEEGQIFGASTIVDAAVGPEGTWSILDQKRSMIFTYDANGQLLFAFGDKGEQLGNLKSPNSITYQDDKLLALDATMNSFTVYTRTEYGDILINALKANNDRRFDEATSYWKAILQRNNNFDAAYHGLGQAAYRSGNWEQAMEYFGSCLSLTDYSDAFKMWRKDWVEKYVIVVPIFIIVVLFGIVKFFGYANKVNKRVAVSGEKRKLSHELLYGFHLIFHPFDGFWDLKHEKRGSLRAALIYLAITIAAFVYAGVGKAFIYQPIKSHSSIFMQIASVALPVLLWVVANWCLTTLMEGEGSFKDILIATCYALLPFPMLTVPYVLLTHVLSFNESGFLSLIDGLMWVWIGLLIFFGCMITHDYTIGKNAVTCIFTIVGMCLIMFIGILFSTLMVKMVTLVSNIATELSYRM